MSAIGPSVGPGHGGLKTAAVLHAAVIAADEQYEQASEEQDDLAPVAAEPPEDSDAGGWLLMDGDAGIRGPSDLESSSHLPLLHKLPKSARPPVYFFIDEEYTVHALGSPNAAPAEMRYAIALAIALHLKEYEVKLTQPGDWRHIPCIGTDAQLRGLAIKAFEASNVASSGSLGSNSSLSIKTGLNKYGAEYKAFAIVLSNADVITPQALINQAQKGKRATRAGALRALADANRDASYPTLLAGEAWDEKTWEKFTRVQNKAKNDQRRTPG